MREIISYENELAWTNHIKTLVKQGHLLLLSTAEKSDMIWKSYMFDMKKGTLKFLMNSCLDTLPTQTNLHQWGKSTTNLCKLCLGADPPLHGYRKETLLHILNHCKKSLNQGRFTWRHDNILRYVCDQVDKTKYKLYADISPYTITGGGTIPPDLCITPHRPDIVIINGDEMTVFELTVPLEPNIHSAHSLKAEKYSYLCSDIDSKKVTILPFEIGSRGYISPENKTRLKTLHSFCSQSTSFTNFIKNISTIALMSSYYIFISRKSADWDHDLKPIGPTFK